MYKFFIGAILVFNTNIIRAQDVKVPAEAKSFIVKGFEPLDYIAGDLNGDKKKDAILILKTPGEDTMMDQFLNRPFLLLIRQADGKLQQVVRNDFMILCRQCGGVFGDPYNGIKLSPAGFNLSFYGGSSWRWSYDYQFVYRATGKSWFLVKEKESNYHSGDPEKTMKNIVITEAEAGPVTIDKFIASPSNKASEWKVKAAKTYFYDSPVLGSKPRKGYLVKGNTVISIRELKNFIEVTYTDGGYNVSSGYILRKDLQLTYPAGKASDD